MKSVFGSFTNVSTTCNKAMDSSMVDCLCSTFEKKHKDYEYLSRSEWKDETNTKESCDDTRKKNV